MKPIILFLAFTLAINISHAQTPQHYSRAKIYLDANRHTIRDLSALGLAVDHGEYKQNTFFISDFSEHEIAKARNAGFTVDILIEDVVKHYQDQNKKPAAKTTSVSCSSTAPAVPAHFHLGSYGGFFTYTEMLSILDSMHTLYPSLISVRQQIDTFHSIQGRPIYWLRISNNPSVDQPAKPQMLVTSLHHAREPGSLSSVIYYLWYLLENYSTDNHIKTIIDNTELYFVPCVNPDGYLYNIALSPGGGGMWRKNMRDNLDGTFGVDLNRNYGFEWGYDDVGSSPMTSDDTYRGTAGFSEPETQAIKWFSNNHHFEIALNYHTYHNDILFPWGYVPNFQTVDSNIFFDDCNYITEYNHYRFGTCNQTLNYIANGDSDDWMYGDLSGKPKIYAATPEIGSNDYGFYPPSFQIIPDCQNTLEQNIKTASLLLPFASIHHTDNKILIHSSGYLHYDVQRLGFPDTGTFTVTILPLDSWMTVSPVPKVYTGLTLLQTVSDSISYNIASATPNGQLISYVLNCYNGHYYIYDTVQFYYGKYYTLTTPSTSSLAGWTNFGWGLCPSTFFTPPSSIKSAPACADNYGDGEDITISTTAPVDLTHSMEAYLEFYGNWGIEKDYDYVTVNASVAGTGVWQPLCGRYTAAEPGSGFPMYDGQRPMWVHEQMDLSDFLGEQINIQYELVSDPFVNDRGFYFDDVSITTVENVALSTTHVSGAAQALSVYPNPAKDELTISLTGPVTLPLHATLYDCVGREVMSLNIDQPQVVVNVQQLPANVYYLKVYGNGKALPVQKVDILK